MFLVELTQLRERFLKERSTDVAEPHYERRQRHIQRGDVGGKPIAV
jgi:hypothetical protein